MKKQDFSKFLKYFLNTQTVYAPTLSQSRGESLIKEISKSSQVKLDGRIPYYPWRDYFLPQKEELFIYKKEKLEEFKKEIKPQVLFGMNLPDLKALALYEQVFEKDSYYQARRRKTVIVGYVNLAAREEFAKWHEDYEENVLEHLIFDIFLEIDKKGNFKVFSGSEKGQKILEDFGYSDYQHIEFAGAVKEGELNKRMVAMKEKMEAGGNKKLWQELGEICLACGKCAIVCPTCFCFGTSDEISENKEVGCRTRCWDTCFYNQFSEVAGGHKFQEEISKRIYFWYQHKFVRIPAEFQVSGCVGCGRCIKTCPVGIDISKNKERILKGK